MKITSEIKETGESEVEIIGEIAAEDFAIYWPKTIRELGETVKIDGFRPGHVPEKVLVDNLGEAAILREMAEQALGEAYREILLENKLDAIGEPNITITKIARGNPLGFKIETAVLPKIELGDYQTIAKKINKEKAEEIKVEEKQIDQVIDQIKTEREHAKYHDENPEDTGHEHDKDNLPKIELNDEFAKSLGNFQTLIELREKIKDNLRLEKEARARELKRLKIIDAIRDGAKIAIPPVLIEAEKNKMLAEMESQVSGMGLKFDDYLKHLKKTREELSFGWTDDARKRVAFGLIVNEISRLENITAPAEELKTQTDLLADRFRDAPHSRLEAYAANVIVNERVLEFLEGVK